MLFIPYEVETLRQETPWANWLIVGVTVVISLLSLFSPGPDFGSFEALILVDFLGAGLFGHVFLHGDLLHLIGNMIFLWVFGNAICTNIGNGAYLITYFACTLLAATAHLLLDGSPAIGASGALNGIIGVTLAMYPINRVHLFYWFIAVGGTTAWRAWHIIIFWFLFDLWGVISGGGLIAYWAHIGGLLGGLAFGLLALHTGWIKLTEYDNRCLLELLKGEEWD